jgi:hypothetical protein
MYLCKGTITHIPPRGHKFLPKMLLCGREIGMTNSRLSLFHSPIKVQLQRTPIDSMGVHSSLRRFLPYRLKSIVATELHWSPKFSVFNFDPNVLLWSHMDVICLQPGLCYNICLFLDSLQTYR